MYAAASPILATDTVTSLIMKRQSLTLHQEWTQPLLQFIVLSSTQGEWKVLQFDI